MKSSPSSYREEEGRAILKLLSEHLDVPIAVDTETTTLRIADPGAGHGIGVSIACVIDDVPYSHYFAVNHATGVNISAETAAMLDYILDTPTSAPDRLLIFANVQFDILSIETMFGTQLDASNFIDICTMAHLCNENQPMNKGVDALAQFYLGEAGKIKDEWVEEEKVKGNQRITPEEMYDYAVMDAVTTWRVWYELLTNPVWVALPDSIWPAKQDLVRVLLEMKRRGVRINQGLAGEQVEIGEQRMKELAAELGYPAIPKKPTKRYPNPDPSPLPVLGPIALTEIFIERLGLPVVKKSKATGKPSFDKTVMEEYDERLELIDSPEAKLVKEYRGWQKAVSAAYRPYLELVGSDGRLRCSYKTHGTVTGRLSCSEPNLQQVPKTSDKIWNGKVKQCFIAREGYTLLNADFSQLELRLGTAYAGEESLKQVFAEGRDIFTEMSVELGFTRDRTKTFVYSTQYGAGVNRIMTAFGVTAPEARKMLDKYASTYPRFKALADRCAMAAEQTGRVKLWSGRYRHFMYSSESFKAMNSVIQGGAADIVERCMVACFQRLDNEDCRMLLQVHDSITWEVKTELVEEYMPKIKAVMEDVSSYVGHDDFDVKFAVDVDFWTDREKTLWEERTAA